MTKLLVAERQNKIVELLRENSSFKMAELAERLNVSKETIRRDLNYLHSIGAVEKSYGGVIAPRDLRPKPIETRIDSALDIKTKICQKALPLIPERSVVYLDTGTTVTCLAKLLREKSGLIIITNSLSAANALVGSNSTVLLTGGRLNSVEMSMDGEQATNFLKTLKFELAVFGTSGFEGQTGPTSCDLFDLQTKKLVLENAKTSVVVAESSKATIVSMMQFANWQDIDYLVTDAGLPDDIHASLKEMTNVVIAD